MERHNTTPPSGFPQFPPDGNDARSSYPDPPPDDAWPPQAPGADAWPPRGPQGVGSEVTSAAFGSAGDSSAAGGEFWPAEDSEADTTDPQQGSAAHPPADSEKKPVGKAGRNLPLAIGAGLVLGGVVLASLLIDRRAFLLVIVAAIAVGTWEMSQAMRQADIRVPTWTLVGCGLGMLALTWFGGPTLLVLGMGLTVMVLVVWRIADGATGYHIDVPAAVLVSSYIPFLGGFAVLLVAPPDGHLRIIVTLATVVLSDTGGYVAGVLAGKHPMAPKISPKKSWEGLGGSILACVVGAVVLLYFLFDAPLWMGLLFGITVAVAATFGDLTESLIKRDLGVKDMSNLVPGHGGLMDRLDSILLALPLAFAWLSFIAPTSI
ncbi:MAG TPA: phosphatidate cytidylyltransferase [Candidatus Stackebrandtia faecavium]|nr:phosphatidate cytidylyltransferase [Candidatus Stackebrandtia faecavium]